MIAKCCVLVLMLRLSIFALSDSQPAETDSFETEWEKVGSIERDKRWSFDEQKKSLMGSLPFGMGDEEEEESESDKKSWERVRASMKGSVAGYSYPEGVDKSSFKLQTVGRFLALHKYFETKDWRFQAGAEKRGMDANFPSLYTRHFPIPRLKTLQPDVVTSCKKGVVECIEDVFGIAIKTYSSNYRLTGSPLMKEFGEEVILYPFRSRVKLFNYRVTAIYYMCWYTMREEKQLERFRAKCLDFEYEYEAANKPWPVDYRSNDKRPFHCAWLSFCPDVCCGRPPSKGPVNSPIDCWKADIHVNPCKKVAYGACHMPHIRNVNFNDLIRNRFNYTCECEIVNEGFEWNSQFELCVDKDECYDNTYTCQEHEFCRNTVGGYECRCKYGYLWDEGMKVCTRHHSVQDMAKAIVTSAPNNPPAEKTGYTLVDDLKILWDLFADSARLTPSPTIIILLLSCYLASS